MWLTKIRVDQNRFPLKIMKKNLKPNRRYIIYEALKLYKTKVNK